MDRCFFVEVEEKIHGFLLENKLPTKNVEISFVITDIKKSVYIASDKNLLSDYIGKIPETYKNYYFYVNFNDYNLNLIVANYLYYHKLFGHDEIVTSLKLLEQENIKEEEIYRGDINIIPNQVMVNLKNLKGILISIEKFGDMINVVKNKINEINKDLYLEGKI